MTSPAGRDCGKAAQAPCCRAAGGALQPAAGQAGAPAWSSTPALGGWAAAASCAGGGCGCGSVSGGWRALAACGCSAVRLGATSGPVLGSEVRMGRGSFLAGGCCGESSSGAGSGAGAGAGSGSGAGAGAAALAALTKPACMAVAKPVVCSVPRNRNCREVSAAGEGQGVWQPRSHTQPACPGRAPKDYRATAQHAQWPPPTVGGAPEVLRQQVAGLEGQCAAVAIGAPVIQVRRKGRFETGRIFRGVEA